MKSGIGTEYRDVQENSYANNETERAVIGKHREGGGGWQVVSNYLLIYFLNQSKSRKSKNKINQGLAKQLTKYTYFTIERRDLFLCMSTFHVKLNNNSERMIH